MAERVRVEQPGLGVDHALAFDRVEQALERGLQCPHPDERRRPLQQHQRIAGADEIRQLLGVAAGAEHRHRQVAKARVLRQQREEGVNRTLGQAVADDDAVDLAGLETARAMIDAERADHAHALADRDAQRRMVAAAADQQHGGVVERIAGRQLGHDVALVLERLGAAKNGGMQCAQPQRAARRARSIARPARHRRSHSAPGSAGCHVLAHADEHRDERHGPGDVADEAATAARVGGIRLGQHDGGGLDLGRRGLRPGPGCLDDRERAGVGEGLRQTAAGLLATMRIGPCSDIGERVPDCGRRNLRGRH